MEREAREKTRKEVNILTQTPEIPQPTPVQSELRVHSIDRTARVFSCLSIAIGGTTLACSVMTFAGEVVNYARDCGVENLAWTALGFPPSTLVECIRETPKILGLFLNTWR